MPDSLDEIRATLPASATFYRTHARHADGTETFDCFISDGQIGAHSLGKLSAADADRWALDKWLERKTRAATEAVLAKP